MSNRLQDACNYMYMYSTFSVSQQKKNIFINTFLVICLVEALLNYPCDGVLHKVVVFNNIAQILITSNHCYTYLSLSYSQFSVIIT